MTIQRTFFFIKPDGVGRGLIGEVIARLERQGLRAVAMQMMRVDDPLAAKLYAEHEGKSFYDELIASVTSGPIVAMAIEGEDAVSAVRGLMGATDPKKAEAGTIRGDFGLEMPENTVHGSDSPESADRELDLFFPRL